MAARDSSFSPDAIFCCLFVQGGTTNSGLPAGLNNLSTLNTSLAGGVGNQGAANPWNAALGQANRLGNPGLGNPGLGNQPLGGALTNSGLQGSSGLQGFPSSQGLQGKPGTPFHRCEPSGGWLLLLTVSKHVQPRCSPQLQIALVSSLALASQACRVSQAALAASRACSTARDCCRPARACRASQATRPSRACA